MRYSFLLIIIFLFIGLSCKKEPKKGYWQLTMMDGNSSGFSTVLNSKNGQDFYGDETGPHARFSCTLVMSGDKIVNGSYTSSGSWSGYYYYNQYTDFEGTCDKKQGSGTCKFRKSNNAYMYQDTTYTGTGTFELKWLYKKAPKN